MTSAQYSKAELLRKVSPLAIYILRCQIKYFSCLIKELGLKLTEENVQDQKLGGDKARYNLQLKSFRVGGKGFWPEFGA